MIPPYILQKRILNTILVKINLKGLHMINWIKGLLGLSLESQLAELATIQTKVDQAKARAEVKKNIEQVKIEYINKLLKEIK